MSDNKYNWKSAVSSRLQGFLIEKHLSGYKFRVQERWLKQFDQYCYDANITEGMLTAGILESFCDRNGQESIMIRQSRLRLLKQFAEYLAKTGHSIGIPPMPDKTFSYPRHEPYIFTNNELKGFFSQIDRWPWTSQSRGNRKKIDPVLFRIIYGCGLRIMEALNLKVSDVNLEEGFLYIRNSKNGRDRIVPMSDGLIERCEKYSKKMHALSHPDTYFFPGLCGGPSSGRSVYGRFREYLWKAGISHSGHGPRVHDLRHTFCVHRFKKWVLEGKELTNLMPYLSAYLGHADFRGTEYYLRLTADLYPEIIAKLEYAHGYIVPDKGVSG